MGDLSIGHPVVELSHAPLTQQFAKAPKTAALFGHGDRKNRLACLTDISSFCDEAQTIEVHVGAASDSDHRLAFPAMVDEIALGTCHRQGTCRLQHAARVLED